MQAPGPLLLRGLTLSPRGPETGLGACAAASQGLLTSSVAPPAPPEGTACGAPWESMGAASCPGCSQVVKDQHPGLDFRLVSSTASLSMAPDPRATGIHKHPEKIFPQTQFVLEPEASAKPTKPSARPLEGKMSDLGAGRLCQEGVERREGAPKAEHASKAAIMLPSPQRFVWGQHVTWLVCGPMCIWVSVCPWWVTPSEGQRGLPVGTEDIMCCTVGLSFAGRRVGVGQWSCPAPPQLPCATFSTSPLVIVSCHQFRIATHELSSQDSAVGANGHSPRGRGSL